MALEASMQRSTPDLHDSPAETSIGIGIMLVTFSVAISVCSGMVSLAVMP
jgi:hypothetical protein